MKFSKMFFVKGLSLFAAATVGFVAMGCQSPVATLSSSGSAAAKNLMGGEPSLVSGKIAFISNRTGTNQVWIKDLDTGSLWQLHTQGIPTSRPAWSPNGQYLAVPEKLSSETFGRIGIYDAAGNYTGDFLTAPGLNGYAAQFLWDASTSEVEGPTWSQDGQQILYTMRDRFTELHSSFSFLDLHTFPAPYDFSGAAFSEKDVVIYNRANSSTNDPAYYSRLANGILDSAHDRYVFTNSYHPSQYNDLVYDSFGTMLKLGKSFYGNYVATVQATTFPNGQSYSNVVPTSISPDGKKLFYNQIDHTAASDLGRGFQLDLTTGASTLMDGGISNVYLFALGPGAKGEYIKQNTSGNGDLWISDGVNDVKVDIGDASNASNDFGPSWWRPQWEWSFNTPGFTEDFALGDPSKKYKIMNRKSGKVLDVTNYSTTSGAAIQQWDYLGGTNQQWKLNAAFDNNFEIRPMSGLSVTNGLTGSQFLSESSTVPGVIATQSSYSYFTDNAGRRYPTANLRWKFVHVPGGYCKIVNIESGLVLQVTDSSMNNGAQIQLAKDTGLYSQNWQFAEVQ